MNRMCNRACQSVIHAALLAVLSLLPANAAGPAPTPEATLQSTAGRLTPVVVLPGERLRVLATTSIVGDVVRQIGGDAVDVGVLLPVGTDPHTFEPTPRDVASIADAAVIFASGAGLETFLDRMLKNAGGQAAVVPVSEGTTLRRMSPEHGQFDDHDHHSADESAAEAEHALTDVDPHTWFTPVNVMVWVRNIVDALSALDPAHASEYQARGSSYLDALTQMDDWIKEQVAQVPPESRKLVTDHLTFGYYADRYGFEQIGAVVPSFSTAAQPSAQELAQLEDAMRQHNVKAVFVGDTVNPSLSARIAEDAGVRLVALYHASLGPTGSGAETYLDLLRYNTTAIVSALK